MLNTECVSLLIDHHCVRTEDTRLSSRIYCRNCSGHSPVLRFVQCIYCLPYVVIGHWQKNTTSCWSHRLICWRNHLVYNIVNSTLPWRLNSKSCGHNWSSVRKLFHIWKVCESSSNTAISTTTNPMSSDLSTFFNFLRRKPGASTQVFTQHSVCWPGYQDCAVCCRRLHDPVRCTGSDTYIRGIIVYAPCDYIIGLIV